MSPTWPGMAGLPTCFAPRRRQRASSPQTRHQLDRELVDELRVIDAKIRAADEHLRQFVTATGSSLPELNGIGRSGAARLIGDITRFTTAAHVASCIGAAPIEGSSGDQKRHRLSRAPATDASTESDHDRRCAQRAVAVSAMQSSAGPP